MLRTRFDESGSPLAPANAAAVILGIVVIGVYASPIWLCPWLIARYAPWLLAGILKASTHAISISVPVSRVGAPGLGAFLVMAGIGTVIGLVTVFWIVSPLADSLMAGGRDAVGRTIVCVMCVVILAAAAGTTGALGVGAFNHGVIHYPTRLSGEVFAISNLPLYALVTWWFLKI
jgi:hypothetical protein